MRKDILHANLITTCLSLRQCIFTIEMVFSGNTLGLHNHLVHKNHPTEAEASTSLVVGSASHLSRDYSGLRLLTSGRFPGSLALISLPQTDRPRFTYITGTELGGRSVLTTGPEPHGERSSRSVWDCVHGLLSRQQ